MKPTKYADLHIHTHYSDSTSSPEEVVKQAQEFNINCIAITDHDTVDGIVPAIEAGKAQEIEVISGIELSSEINGKDVHILGYGFDYKDEELLNILKSVQSSRVERMRLMIEKLEELGVSGISLEEVCSKAKSDAVGRPHLAATLVEKGIVSNIKAAFDKYLADDAPACVSKFKQSPYEAIALIVKMGGVAVLAHPMHTAVDELIPSFVEAGMKGLEVYYPNCSENVIQYYKRLADKNNLLATGGSDAHGDSKKHTYVGKLRVDYQIVEEIKKLSRFLS